jgi:hypothetical protein
MERCLIFKKLIPTRAEGPNPPMENLVPPTKQLDVDMIILVGPLIQFETKYSMAFELAEAGRAVKALSTKAYQTIARD